jgi:hypothetical protein
VLYIKNWSSIYRIRGNSFNDGPAPPPPPSPPSTNTPPLIAPPVVPSSNDSQAESHDRHSNFLHDLSMNSIIRVRDYSNNLFFRSNAYTPLV